MTIGVIIAQLGTPDAPTAGSLRPYLRQFLSDMRVIDYHPLIWQPILRGIVLRVRPRKSAKLYQRIWTDEGSPLLLHSRAQVKALQEKLGCDYRVILGMTYGNPSIGDAVKALERDGIDRILVLPMFPQFSSTTTACIYDAVYRAAAGNLSPWRHDRKRFTPALRFVAPWYAHPAYIRALQTHLEAQINTLPQPPDLVALSFHGIPRRYIQTGDPYLAHCQATADSLAKSMGWRDDQWTLSYQSRFGPEAWLEPYTEELLQELPKRGVRRTLVFAPGFVTDCLETLDELGNEGCDEFVAGGGDAADFTLAPCLNASPGFIDALAQLTLENAAGWTVHAAEAESRFRQ